MERTSMRTAGAFFLATLVMAGLLSLIGVVPAHAEPQPTVTINTRGTGHVAISETNLNVKADSSCPAETSITISGEKIYVAFSPQTHYSYLEYIDISDGTHTYRIGQISLDDYEFSFDGTSAGFQMNSSSVSLISYGIGGNINISCGLAGIEDDLAITAVYHKVDPFTLTVYRNFDASDPTVLETRQVYRYEEIGPEPTVPQRDGYRFVGWSRDREHPFVVQWDPADTLTQSETWYAIWEPAEPEPAVSHDLVFHANDGSADDIVSSVRTAAGAPLGAAPQAPQRDGYRFLGWAASPDATEPIVWDGSTPMPDEDVAFYAVWEKIESAETPESPEENPPSQPGDNSGQNAPEKQDNDPSSNPTGTDSQQKGASALAKTGDGTAPLTTCLLSALGATAAVAIVAVRRKLRD